MLKQVWLSENLFSLVIPINIIPLFSKDLITFRIPFKKYFARNSVKVDPTFDIEFDIAVSATGIIVNIDPPNCVTLLHLCGKITSLLDSPTTFDERFEVTSVPTFCSWFKLVSN